MDSVVTMCDLQNRAGIDTLLYDFHSRVFNDELLRRVFVDVANMNLVERLPVIGVPGKRSCSTPAAANGQAMSVHRRLHQREPLTPAHFQRWLGLWRRALEADHAGPVAAAAKQHAVSTAEAIRRHLDRVSEPYVWPAVAATPDRGSNVKTVSVKRRAAAVSGIDGTFTQERRRPWPT
ncbi:group III truncated hemoglobin [Blastococcus sp. TF02A-26]|uniref:group III truncated hemoglobin n=1 Tax=Blastococcus sp. TF02A-26 TaxID=2250577 RepID=UPI0011BF4D1B|nr:group III truncated hemoglobin [Blastococcus sp. TF02A-26]